MLSELKLYLVLEFNIRKKHIECKVKDRWYYNHLQKRALRAFTLAEVLITLLIIGIVASLVIPALIADTQQVELITAWKKIYSITDQATKMIMLDNGGTLIGAFQGSADMINKYCSYFSCSKKCLNTTDCWHKANTWMWYNKSPIQESYFGLILNDGTILAPVYFDSNCTSTLHTLTIEKCGWFFVDVNGFKGPNTIDKDIFYIYVLKDRIAPRGIPGDAASYMGCPSSGGCSAKYLYQ